MKTFQLTADVTFEAIDAADAADRLATHFATLRDATQTEDDKLENPQYLDMKAGGMWLKEA